MSALRRQPGLGAQRHGHLQAHGVDAELEEQMTELLSEYTGNGEFLSPHAPKERGCYDDAATLLAIAASGIGCEDRRQPVCLTAHSWHSLPIWFCR